MELSHLKLSSRIDKAKATMDSQNGRDWSYDSLRNFRELSPAVQNHLKRVYITLSGALLAATFGAYIHMLWNIGGLVTTLGVIGSRIWFHFIPSYEKLSKRLSLLFLSAVLKGASVGPTIKLVIDHFDSSVVITSFVGTVVVFVCFSAAAMLSRRREYLYLGGTLYSSMCILWWVRFASSIFGSSTNVFMFEQYFGLYIFVGYIVVYTQMIIEKAHRGDMDYVKDSFNFFIDFASLFGRLLVLNLIKKKRLKLKAHLV